jgi:hypothetical protein
MPAVALPAHAPACPLAVQVFGADAAPLPAAEIARLFPQIAPATPRFERLMRFARVVVSGDTRIVGLAVYHAVGEELRVPELAIVPEAETAARDILDRLLDALEAACLAGGARRIVLTPPVRSLGLLRRRGYALISEGCAGTWMEKTFK